MKFLVNFNLSCFSYQKSEKDNEFGKRAETRKRCQEDPWKEDERYAKAKATRRRLVSMCLLQLPLSLLSRSASGKPVRLTWEFYLRLDFLRLTLRLPPRVRSFPSSVTAGQQRGQT